VTAAPKRQQLIVETFEVAFADLMRADPNGFRTKYRKMAADPFAFYRGSACLFYEDMSHLRDPWTDDRTSRVWIHGDLHAENFGTYMNSDGVLVFDVNDFDEAYLGHFNWDVRRFVASLALMGWQKALPDESIRSLARAYVEAYVDQVRLYVEGKQDEEFALRMDNTDGHLRSVLLDARMSTRVGLLNANTTIDGNERRFIERTGVRRLGKAEEKRVRQAFDRYLESIPENKRQQRQLFYAVKDVVGRTGFGVGSAGLPAYNVLIEGFNQALENDVILSMKQANHPAVSRVVDVPEAREFFEHEGHRTVISQRALQVHTDPMLGWTTIGDVGYVVDELSPYEADLAWGEITEPDEMRPVLADLGRATAKIHCVSDSSSDESLVTFSTEHAIAEVIGDGAEQFVADMVDFGVTYADRVRKDHALFVDAFREGRIGGVAAT
jgi:uncharacterized protein (DUF2252 family)